MKRYMIGGFFASAPGRIPLRELGRIGDEVGVGPGVSIDSQEIIAVNTGAPRMIGAKGPPATP